MGRILLAICGLVVAMALSAAAQGPSNGAGGEARADQGDGSSSQNITVAADLGRIASALEAQNTDEGAKREKRDLHAQEDMAIWAKRMFWATVAAVVLSGVGIVLIYTTFRETRRTANAGDKMAEEAAKATAAALRSAAVAEKALVGVERPFVVINPAQFNEYYVNYIFSNYGRTPAVIMHSDVRYLAITPLDGPEPLTANVLQAALTPGWEVVPPNGGKSDEAIVRPGKPIVEGAERAEMWMLHGYVMYRSLTGEYFVSGFGLYRKIGEPWKAVTGAAFNYDERLEKGGPRKRQRPTLTVTAHKKPNPTKQEH